MSNDNSGIDVDAALSDLQGWERTPEGAISKTFKFKDFPEAFAFMARVALLAEKANHHPDWSNSYNRVTVALKTHDKDAVTQKDIDLATAISAI